MEQMTLGQAVEKAKELLAGFSRQLAGIRIDETDARAWEPTASTAGPQAETLWALPENAAPGASLRAAWTDGADERAVNAPRGTTGSGGGARARAIPALTEEDVEPLRTALTPIVKEAVRELSVELDGESVGRLVSATVNREIGRAARARRYTG